MRISEKERYCHIHAARGYGDGEFNIIKVKPDTVTLRDPRTNEVFDIYQAHIYVTLEQRRRSAREVHMAADAIGRSPIHPKQAMGRVKRPKRH